ncbi:beta-lactamase-like protein [Massariosphaeria phaeospora]|uniref:Protein artemis n=1 Tax=Massariosphaeria phaeospora TaxID=100035 RepID=A0A7C8MGH5_9PLEO|nr:beta-lactamase-like protein [Massariosphaeria phaeospora]
MSTFKGIIAEFPHIRIDYFRQQPGHKAPLACFLSHVHSDHLTGLESMRAPFVYCSAATREILLRLEKYHYRMNFARGILESRTVTYDRSMRKLAKPLPLETPTTIELSPGNTIRVTLIDANHCVGAVMFLVEGDGKVILYTGDIRAETWWVNSLIQNPVLLPYTIGNRRLDCMYLDTTFAAKSEPYREFPTKAEGIRELLEKVESYPNDTIFYFHSWTFGYENVWIALSAFLQSQIHLDDYRARIYSSLSTLEKKFLRDVGLNVKADNKYLRESGLEVREAPALCGFRNGNHIQPGCLTSRPNVRLHSCELGTGCSVMDHDKDAKAVHIIPIVTRANGLEIAELGVGGGKGDIDQKEELETGDVGDIGHLMELCAKTIEDQELLSKVLALLQKALDESDGKLDLGTDFQSKWQDSEDELSLQALVSVLSSHASKEDEGIVEKQNETIRFPYSRHSSYAELCTLVKAFQPRNLYPCTVDENSWTPSVSMQHLFGAFCSGGGAFPHDAEMMEIHEARLRRERAGKRAAEQNQMETQYSEEVLPTTPKRARTEHYGDIQTPEENTEDAAFVTPTETLTEKSHVLPTDEQIEIVSVTTAPPEKKQDDALAGPKHIIIIPDDSPPPVTRNSCTTKSHASTQDPESVSSSIIETPTFKLTNRELAYKAGLGDSLTWADFGGLVSTRDKRDYYEEEL